MIETKLTNTDPNIILVKFSGRISLEEVGNDRAFGEIIKGLNGAPFSVVCDFADAVIMSEEVSKVFIKAQSFAVDRGMIRDAFVCTSAVIRLQFSRIARESGRAKSLGKLRFFETAEEAYAYINSK